VVRSTGSCKPELFCRKGVYRDFESLASDKPVPPVGPDDLKRVWYVIQEHSGSRQSTEGCDHGAWGIDIRLLEPHCGPVRMWPPFQSDRFLLACLGAGLLDDWRESTELPDRFFRVAATFPDRTGHETVQLSSFVSDYAYKGCPHRPDRAIQPNRHDNRSALDFRCYKLG
jgi:hypothetical protein